MSVACIHAIGHSLVFIWMCVIFFACLWSNGNSKKVFRCVIKSACLLLIFPLEEKVKVYGACAIRSGLLVFDKGTWWGCVYSKGSLDMSANNICIMVPEGKLGCTDEAQPLWNQNQPSKSGSKIMRNRHPHVCQTGIRNRRLLNYQQGRGTLFG